MKEQLQFIVPDGTDLAGLQTKLCHALDLTEISSAVIHHIYLDTFDWRLYESDSVLELTTHDGEFQLVWRPLMGNRARASVCVAATPVFINDIPAGRLHNGLKDILEMRALLPQVKLDTRVQLFSLLDHKEKTMMSLKIEQHTLQSAGLGRRRKLGVRIQILPIKGYPKPVKRAVNVLSKKIGLKAVGQDLMLAALEVDSRQVGAYSSKLGLILQPEMRTDAAVRAIMLRLMEIIEDNWEGVCKDLDSEFLHDFRVAVRKTRSALTQIKGVFPKHVFERYRADFAWLGSVTGPTRDMDVYLLKFDQYSSSLPGSMRGDLVPLHEFLIRHQKKEQAALEKALNSARYRNMMKSWHTVLESKLPIHSRLPNATRPAIEVADERIMHIYQRVLKQGRAIGPDSPVERLHDLRKSCKKLRYLMAFFESLYPAKRIAALLNVLKSLQENLGDFQDYVVQAANMKHFSQQMMEEGDVPADTLVAMGILVEKLEEGQHQVREEFTKRFTKFALPENQKHFHDLFNISVDKET